MLDYWTSALVAVASVGALWLLLRCPVGFHAPGIIERAKRADGRDDPFKVNWRCPRCMRISGSTEARPHLPTRMDLYRQRDALKLDRSALLCSEAAAPTTVSRRQPHNSPLAG